MLKSRVMVIMILSLVFYCRQNEIQSLKEALALQNQKRDDLNKYKHHVHTEYQENAVSIFDNVIG